MIDAPRAFPSRAAVRERLAAAVRRVRSGLLGAAADRRGAAAVEFALIVPILLCLYFVTLEVSQAVETSKKVSRVGSMVADLVTQQPSMTKAEADAVMAIGKALLQPYNRTNPTIAITAIQVSNDATLKATVVWSRKLANDGSYGPGLAKGSTVTTLPAKLKVAGTFLVRVESALLYKPLITYTADEKKTLGLTAAFDQINMGDVYYLRPRMSDTVPCTDC